MSALRRGNGFPYDLFMNYLNGKEEIGPNWAWTLSLYLHTNINVYLKRLIASFNHQIVFWLLTECEAHQSRIFRAVVRRQCVRETSQSSLLKLQHHDCDLLRWRHAHVRSFSVTVNNAHWCSNLRLRGVAVMCKVKKNFTNVLQAWAPPLGQRNPSSPNQQHKGNDHGGRGNANGC